MCRLFLNVSKFSELVTSEYTAFKNSLKLGFSKIKKCPH